MYSSLVELSENSSKLFGSNPPLHSRLQHPKTNEYNTKKLFRSWVLVDQQKQTYTKPIVVPTEEVYRIRDEKIVHDTLEILL